MAKRGKAKGGTGAGKTAKKQRTKTAAAPAKKTAEQLSDEDRQRLLLNHKRRIKPLLAIEKQAKDDVSAAYEKARKEGVTKKDIELAIKLETEEGRVAVTTALQRMLDIDRWTGKAVGTQLELFAKEKPAERIFEEGRRAALEEQPRVPPSHYNDRDQRTWIEGHAQGVHQMNRARQAALDGMAADGGAKPIGEVVNRIVTNAEPEGERQAA